MQRPLNVHPDIWNLRKKQLQNSQYNKNEEKKQLQLDQFTKLCNAIDLIAQGAYLFKNVYSNINWDEYSQSQFNVMKQVDNIISCAIIPYSIDMIKKLNVMSQDKQK